MEATARETWAEDVAAQVSRPGVTAEIVRDIDGRDYVEVTTRGMSIQVERARDGGGFTIFGQGPDDVGVTMRRTSKTASGAVSAARAMATLATPTRK